VFCEANGPFAPPSGDWSAHLMTASGSTPDLTTVHHVPLESQGSHLFGRFRAAPDAAGTRGRGEGGHALRPTRRNASPDGLRKRRISFPRTAGSDEAPRRGRERRSPSGRRPYSNGRLAYRWGELPYLDGRLARRPRNPRDQSGIERDRGGITREGRGITRGWEGRHGPRAQPPAKGGRTSTVAPVGSAACRS
jgi:hypothetical protein